MSRGRPIMGRPTSAETHRITAELRGFARSFPLRTQEAGVRLRVERHEGQSFMKYALVIHSSTLTSTIVMFDPRTRQAWVRPIKDEHHEIVRFLTREFHGMRHGGAVLGEFSKQGYTMVGGSHILATTMTGTGRIQ